MSLHRVDVLLTPLEGEVLAAIRKIGTTNLDQLYRARPGGRGFTYAEVVRAVHSLVQHRLVSRVHERNRYFYQVEELVGSSMGVGYNTVYISREYTGTSTMREQAI